MSVLNSVELIQHWKQHIRNSRADSLRGMRKYRNLFGDASNITGYFEGKAQAQDDFIKILNHMVEYQEMFHGDG